MTIWCEFEVWPNWDPLDDNSDVIVTLEDGSRWGATFVTYRNVETLVAKNRQTGECLSGRYLDISHLVLVEALTRPLIEAVVEDILQAETLEPCFARLTDAVDKEAGLHL
ncbi:MAG: hypothetical protein HFF50_02715 [Lawsonibacter sp.]|nr:hypothetical protein [Lawsonibacter sp.]